MTFRTLVAPAIATVLLTVAHLRAQDSLATDLSELVQLRAKVGDADTRTRVDALHRVWAIALGSPRAEVKLAALDLLGELVGSSSDHIRMPAVYAIAEIANSTGDAPVKLRALAVLREPLQASQVPIRDVAIDALNSIVRTAGDGEVVVAAVHALGAPVRSGNNGVRIPAINAILRAVEGSRIDAARQAALDLLAAPLESDAMIGGLEVRMMALGALERIGVTASEIGTKAKAIGMLQSYASKGGWEPEAKRRAQRGASSVQASMTR